MKRAGLDIGSRFIKYAVIDKDGAVSFYKKETGHNPMSVCEELFDSDRADRLTATGYGRHLMEISGNANTITEIKAVARGAREVFPCCRTVIDIGGQDTKVISLKQDGGVQSFEMNDRCAAGTGRFLEIMAKALGYDIREFGRDGYPSDNSNISINSMCTVFAESEVIGLINKGIKREAISYALHSSVTQKVTALTKRIDVKDDIVFAGGCALNGTLVDMFKDTLQKNIHVHETPDMLAALGAALY
ncbi:MAG: hypothetical protein HQK88_10525 [Nitrospirae bacterium]|nr:hypothetical protein [Nitrospirota bacterium]MBF0534915.1 hypothetical protein [Nitrospirota bacterium]MBF0617234.1 hypothetical protein [Nitrospirota bacterium]